MSDYLTQLTARSFQRQTDIRPRIAARFEPLMPYTGGFTEVRAETPAPSPAASTSPPQPSPAPQPHAADITPPVINQQPAPNSDMTAPDQQPRIESPTPAAQQAPPVMPSPEPQEIIRTVRVVEHHEREIHHAPQIIERASAPPDDTPASAQAVFVTPEPEPTVQPVSEPPDMPVQQSEPPAVAPPHPPQMTPVAHDEDDTPRRTAEKSPSISVSINRVDVRAATPPKPSPPPRPAPSRRTPYRPSVSLDDYLKRRGGRS